MDASGRVRTIGETGARPKMLQDNEQNLPRQRQSLALRVGVTALLGAASILVMEPAHTSGMPVLTAFGLWFTHFLAIGVMVLLSLSICSYLGIQRRVAPVLSLLIVPFLLTPLSFVLDRGFGNPDPDAGSLGQELVSEFLAVSPFGIAAALVFLFVLPSERRPVSERPREKVDELENRLPRLRDVSDQIPADIGDDLITMKAQDHYVEVVATQGKALISEKFSDCVERADPFGGLQCHRSHWVRLRHVRSVDRAGSIYVCVMSNGMRVPVSRNRWPQLKAALKNAEVGTANW